RFHLYDRRSGKRVRYERVTRPEESPVFEPEISPETSAEIPADAWPTERASATAFSGSPIEERSVEADDVVRGFELPGGDLVTVSDDELVSIAPERSRT